MDVIFGGIATLAFQRLIDQLQNLEADASLYVLIIGSISVFIFFIYDVTILHFLYKVYPYKLGWQSSTRFFIDFSMTFLLALVVLPIMNGNPEETTFVLLVSITIWHLFAAIWHFLANYELNGCLPQIKQVIQHFINPAIYWTAAIIILVCQHKPIEIKYIKSEAVFITICILIATLSIYRAVNLIPKLQSMINNNKNIEPE